MKSLLLRIVMLIFLFPACTWADGIVIPDELQARAIIVRTDRDGLWEKSLVVQFPERRRLLSTKDGFVDALVAVNHAADPRLWAGVSETMQTKGGQAYETKTEERLTGLLQLRRGDLTLMATAADMDNLAVVTRTFAPFIVTVLATAGAETNALRAGVDEGTHIESEPGTVNIMILSNARLTDGAMARAIITGTEAKTAAFEDLRVPSSYTKGVQATGTGTDSMMVVSGKRGPQVTYTGGHSRIGELIGKAVYAAVVEALGKQNGFVVGGKKDGPIGERPVPWAGGGEMKALNR